MTPKSSSDEERVPRTGVLWFRASAALLRGLLLPLEGLARRVLEQIQEPVPPQEWPRTPANGLGAETAAFAENMAQLLRDHGAELPQTHITAEGLQGRVDAARALEQAMAVLDRLSGLLHALWAIHLGAARREANQVYRLARVTAAASRGVARAIQPILNKRRQLARKSGRQRKARRQKERPSE